MSTTADSLAAAEAVSVPGERSAEAVADAQQRMGDLAEIIRAYNEVTERLQHSHERLKGEVLRLRRELASTNAQLQRSKRLSALGEMAAGIAHEIRNPLAAIQLYAGMIVEDLAPDEPTRNQRQCAHENGRKIATAVRGLNGIVNDVLAFSREMAVRPHLVDVSELLDEVIEAHRPAVEAANVRVERRDRDEPVEVWADRELLQRALLNVVRNAVDAMSDAPERVLTLEAARDDAGVALRVQDTGPGIEQANVERIFNPFFTTRNTGTGLGLAIVHRIIDAHGGTIEVHNEGGAVFTLTLPHEIAGRTNREKEEAAA